MPIVSNTSPLLNLAIINQLDLLQQQFQQVLIPEAVLAELQIDYPLPGSHLLKQAIDDGWIVIHAIQDRYLASSLALDLDRGEAEAITLALELTQPHLLLDERDARLAAKLLGMQPLGILGVLLRAKRLQQIVAVKPLLEQLQRQAGFYIASPLIQQILHTANEDQ